MQCYGAALSIRRLAGRSSPCMCTTSCARCHQTSLYSASTHLLKCCQHLPHVVNLQDADVMGEALLPELLGGIHAHRLLLQTNLARVSLMREVHIVSAYVVYRHGTARPPGF
jgi:hypothetical protein